VPVEPVTGACEAAILIEPFPVYILLTGHVEKELVLQQYITAFVKVVYNLN
jgi:hypothetical protein